MLLQRERGAAAAHPAARSGLRRSCCVLDPGNVATNTQAGAAFGYLLLWVLVGATLMAGLVQYLSAKAGWLTGETLPALVARRNSTVPRICYWIQAELVAMATDLAEIVGGAVALNLLFGLPLVTGAIVTTVVSTGLLFLQNTRSQQTFERVITGMLAIVTIGFWRGWLPRLRTPERLLLGWCQHSAAPKAQCSQSACSARPSCRTPSTCIPRSSGTGTDGRTPSVPHRCSGPSGSMWTGDAGRRNCQHRDDAARCEHPERFECGRVAGRSWRHRS